MHSFIKTTTVALQAMVLSVLFAGAAYGADSVDINTADAQTIDRVLVNIGPSKAQAIVEHRKSHGPFKSVDDLKQVKGFRDKLVERLRPELTVAAAPSKAAPKSDVADSKAKPVAPVASGRIEERPRK